MTNYADPAATTTVYLEPCGCPGQPHAKDAAVVVARFGYGARGAIIEAGRRGGEEAAHLVTILRGVRSWNLVLPDGSPRPLDPASVELLDVRTVQWLLDATEQAWGDDDLPNGSSGPSPAGSPESPGPTPTTDPEPPADSTST